ncbi:MAG: hypothetical protein M1839_006331 [Geoglossum umbratile]|nr:MAG: hypothetical protein M1839_006331 [Geoglossum umbratile]
MYIENLVEYLQTNLTTTKKRYTHEHHIQLALFCQLAGFSGNHSSTPGPPFTKQFLGVKDANKFPLPEIIFDPSLILSQHAFLLGLIFADRAFAAPNLISAGHLSGLDDRPGYQLMGLLLKPSMLDVLVFRKSVRTGYGSPMRNPLEPGNPPGYGQSSLHCLSATALHCGNVFRGTVLGSKSLGKAELWAGRGSGWERLWAGRSFRLEESSG